MGSQAHGIEKSPGVQNTPRKEAPELNDWLQELRARGGILGALLAASTEQQNNDGYWHTLREIAQQPFTWEQAAASVPYWCDSMVAVLQSSDICARHGKILLTGSGSSLYAGESIVLSLRSVFGLQVEAVSAGLLLTHSHVYMASGAPTLLVSLARSGDSPESCAAIDVIRAGGFDCHHLIITCNAGGRLAISYKRDHRVKTVLLPDNTNDRSLVMTSSFTNMVLAARVLAHLTDNTCYQLRLVQLARAGREILLESGDELARIGGSDFSSAVYLGTADRCSAARECSLKMIEMTAGRVRSFSESYLGLRHGPLSAVDSHSLVVAFLSSDPLARKYELDLLAELERKRLGAYRVVVGADIPPEVANGGLIIDTARAGIHDDEDMPMLDVLTGQLLAFFRSRHEKLKPDNPSPAGIIRRVVESFKIHDQFRNAH